MTFRTSTRAALAAMLALIAAPALAQIQTVDPNSAIDADLAAPAPRDDNVYYDDSAPPPPADDWAAPAAQPSEAETGAADADLVGPDGTPVAAPSAPVATAPADAAAPAPATNETIREQAAAATYGRNDLIAAAEGVFGKGAEGLAGIIENILKDQGEPSAYIAGREASGAFILGVRYGSGTLFHTVEGQRPAFWTGPSVGFDVGGNAAQTFVLVYNLYDTQDLYRRFPAGEGNAYLVGGFTASYMRWGDVVLIPIRLGVGWRLGVNAGYMRFTEKQNWLPF